jgi:hypothetical protein
MSWRDLGAGYGRGLACCVLLLTAAATTAAFAEDRSLERLRYTCSNELGRRDITLFANGTVRLREGSWEEQQMLLGELSPEELESKLRVLAEIRDDSVEPRLNLPGTVMDGPWVDHCEVLLELPQMVRIRIEFSRFDVPPLWVSRAIHFAEQLTEKVRPLGPVERLAPDYRPRPWDLLENREGKRFVVIGLTGDNKGVELEAVDAPLRSFHFLEDLRLEFILVDRRRDR